MYFYLKTVALNPNKKIDYYEVVGTWKTTKEIQRDKLESILVVMCLIIVISLLVSVLIYV